jgi:hypothetical protein
MCAPLRGTLGVVPDAYKKVTNMYRTYAIAQPGDVKDNSNESAEFVFSNLVAEAVYLFASMCGTLFRAEMDDPVSLTPYKWRRCGASWNERTAITNANRNSLRWGGVCGCAGRAMRAASSRIR